MNNTDIDILQNKFQELIKEEALLKQNSITTFELICDLSILKKYKEGTYINGKIEVGKKKIEFFIGAESVKGYFKEHETVVFILRNGSYCCCAKKSEYELKNQSLLRIYEIKNEKMEISLQIDKLLHPKKYIKLIDISNNNVYIEYINFDSETVSFTKAKSIIRESQLNKIKYDCVDSEKAINFLNNLPRCKLIYSEHNSERFLQIS